MSRQASPDPTAEPAASAPQTPAVGARIGGYEIIDVLGHGSMATVYLARDSTGHEVALKVFQEGPGVSPTMLERFKREAEASKKLRRHPNIMKVYATGQDGIYHFIVMEPIRNSRTLEDVIQNQTLSVDQILTIGVKIARALHYAHTRHIVHRDVKPSNIMIDEFGEPLLTDFGVAELIDWPSCTISGALTGTPLYMSPEQARAEHAGPRSDIYSLGVVLYEALTGVLPYSVMHSSPVKQVLEAVKNESPKRLRYYRRDIPADVEAVILKALEKNEQRRYDDAESFADDLERARTGRPVAARMATWFERAWELARQYDQFFAAAFVMLAMAIGGGIYLRLKLLEARYENLINLAHFRNSMLRSGASVDRAGESGQHPAAWNEIRQARRDFSAGRWSAAKEGFQNAFRLSQSIGDGRTAALAGLELARIEAVLGHFEEAMGLYRGVLENPDVSSAIGQLAHLEAVQIALLRDAKGDAARFLGAKPLPAEGPFRDALRCLSGELTVRELSDRAEQAPARLRNDLLFTAAVRSRLDGDTGAYTAFLRKTLQESVPSWDWPAPLARLLLE